MSGGIAYVYDADRHFSERVNYEMVDLESLEQDDCDWLVEVVARHRELTGSTLAARLLSDWGTAVHRFRKVMPRDYKRVMRVMREAEQGGVSLEEAHGRVMVAAHG
jgi:glutamate synthase (NADPH/NADH) large chain